jgi:hypothetical protein
VHPGRACGRYCAVTIKLGGAGVVATGGGLFSGAAGTDIIRQFLKQQQPVTFALLFSTA